MAQEEEEKKWMMTIASQRLVSKIAISAPAHLTTVALINERTKHPGEPCWGNGPPQTRGEFDGFRGFVVAAAAAVGRAAADAFSIEVLQQCPIAARCSVVNKLHQSGIGHEPSEMSTKTGRHSTVVATINRI